MGTQISDMTVAAAPLPAGTFFPLVVADVATGLNPALNYRYDLGTDLLTRVSYLALAASNGSTLVGFLQAGTGAIERTAQAKLRDALNLLDFTNPTDSVAAQTAGVQKAIAQGIAANKALRIPGGSWTFNAPLFALAVVTDTIRIFGDGMHATIINNAATTSLFNIGNSRFATIHDLTITGNGLTGASGNGHAIDLTNPGSITDGPFYPQHCLLARLLITGHQGNGVPYLGATMPACGIYSAGSLSITARDVYLGSNGFGAYNVQSAQMTFDTCIFDSNTFAACVNDQGQNFRIVNPDVVGNHGIGATALATGSLGQIRCGNYGVQSTGGTLVKAGAITDYFGQGSEYWGGKHKNHLYAAFSLNSPFVPLVGGVSYIRQEVDGTCGVFNVYGARVVNCTFVNGTPASGSIGSRYGIWTQLMGEYGYVGALTNNHFITGGTDATQGIAIFVDGSAAGGATQSGLIDGNSLGDAGGVATTSTWADFIKLTETFGGMAVTNNHAVASTNVTITTVYNYTGITSAVEGLVDDNNSYLVQGGTVTTGKVLPTNYTGLQRTGFFNVAALTVQGVQVVGARNTGWTAGTGSAAKGAFAAYAGATMSAGYVQAEAQATNDAVKAVSQRLLAIEQALTTGGTIGP